MGPTTTRMCPTSSTTSRRRQSKRTLADACMLCMRGHPREAYARASITGLLEGQLDVAIDARCYRTPPAVRIALVAAPLRSLVGMCDLWRVHLGACKGRRAAHMLAVSTLCSFT